MAATKKTGTAGAGEAAALPADAARLHRALVDVDALACGALEVIVGLSRLALAYMETPESLRAPESIAQALEAILSAAQVADDCIGGELEELGMTSGSPARRRRMEMRLNASCGGCA